jgi:formylglycine-generating enzyme required for sulfatase activity
MKAVRRLWYTLCAVPLLICVGNAFCQPLPGGAEPPADEITNSAGMRMRLVRPGSFNMGSNDGWPEEKPAHRVRLTKPYYISATEVTQAQYEKVMGANPSAAKGPNLPVTNITWHDAKEFCARLSEQEKRTYRLPTEAEQEYACRAGSTSERYWGNAPVADYAWYQVNSGGRTHEVARLKPNAWGLYDAVGNVWEWSEDWYAEYSTAGQTDPTGPQTGTSRVLRGGSWGIGPCLCRSAARAKFRPDESGGHIGMRVVLSVPQPD